MACYRAFRFPDRRLMPLIEEVRAAEARRRRLCRLRSCFCADLEDIRSFTARHRRAFRGGARRENSGSCARRHHTRRTRRECRSRRRGSRRDITFRYLLKFDPCPTPLPCRHISREEVRRLLRISERQLKSWEQQKLVPRDGQLRLSRADRLTHDSEAARRSRAGAANPPRARRAARQTAAHRRSANRSQTLRRREKNPRRSRRARHGGRVRPVAAQLRSGRAEAPAGVSDKDRGAEERDQRATAERWFQRGLDLEQSGAPAETSRSRPTTRLSSSIPKSAGALVNLGTLYFNARKWKEAEQFYRRRLKSIPTTLWRISISPISTTSAATAAKALEHYEAALRLSPNYADAHYNLALLYQGSNQTMKAVHHWTAYLKLDGSSHWANIARRELTKLRKRRCCPARGACARLE